ncbi:hypothetical protein APX70_06113 [Pseudomonas syringae pv. maculicola]|uniref:Uncharacterized protein n=1 Tax=Pseudomonas syringae pv. maculicola TaxID=59511 RepID=A0A3M2YV60_PSEYM|nr:hypothetical protein APX70_06113 [Pseudomonas syringae pv. maculicola]
MVASLVAELLVDALEVVQAHAKNRDPVLLTSGVLQNPVQPGLQLQPVGQAGQGVDPDAQFVFLMALEQRQLVFAGAVRIDRNKVFDDF